MRAARTTSAVRLGLWIGAMTLVALGAGASFAARMRPPAGVPEARLGEAVFNTLFVPAGTPGAARHSGLGPLFDAPSCDECHNGAAQARGPAASGPAPTGLIIGLEEAQVPPGRRPRGDPRYGLVLSTEALPGVAPEARVTVRYGARHGRFPDGTPFTLRVPRYLITHLGYGPLAPHTRIEPRLAPSLFGVGWLARVPAVAIVAPPQARAPATAASFGTFSARWRAGREEVGRLGWQATSVSVRDQTAKALERDMGVTSRDYPRDDCTAAEVACRARAHGGTPEIPSELVAALVAYQLSLPRPGPATPGPPDPTFVRLGCAACHRPRLPVTACGGCSPSRQEWIAPYTDLRLHFLGTALDDRDASGRPVLTRWRTAPLWNLADRRHPGLTLLHDGRARSIEEAILWHGGEAGASRARFMRLTRNERQQLLEWLSRL